MTDRKNWDLTSYPPEGPFSVDPVKRKARSSGITLFGCRVFLDASDDNRFWAARDSLQRMAERRNENLGSCRVPAVPDTAEEADADVIFVKRIEVVKEVPVIREHSTWEEAKPPSKPAVNEAHADWRKGFVAGAIYACVMVAILGTAALWILRTHGAQLPEQHEAQPSGSHGHQEALGSPRPEDDTDADE